jgi:manganese/iron transport system permease protein
MFTEFMQRASVEILVLAVLCGVVGTVVQMRRQSFLVDALGHTMFPGIAAAFFLDGSLLVGALVAAVLSTLMFTGLASVRRADENAVLALVVSTFFAAGVVLVSRRPTFQGDLTRLLYGRLLTVDRATIVQTAILTGVVLVTLKLTAKEIVFRSFDPEAARAAGYRIMAIDAVVNACTALAIVACVRAVGTALAVALLITPAATARLVGGRLASTMTIATACIAVAGLAGLAISYQLSVSHDLRVEAGPTIVTLLTALFVVAAAARRFRTGRRSPAVTP